MKVSGNQLLAQAVERQGADTLFFIMGGPTNDAILAMGDAGIKLIDVRHEQAAAMMAHAYGRVKRRPAVCMGASGPGAINLTTGLATALVDCAPVVAFGGSSPQTSAGTEAFQAIDQLEIMKPVTKWADRVLETRRIPEYVDRAFSKATSGNRGPVYLDLPGDVLYGEVEEDDVLWPNKRNIARMEADPATISEVVSILEKCERPLILSGSGVLWSSAEDELSTFVGDLGIPFYTTPQGRGAVPEDSPYFYGTARSTAFREADIVFVVGTRLSYVFGHGNAPRFSPDAKFVMINIDEDEIARSPRADIGLVGDARSILRQLTAEVGNKIPHERFAPWQEKLKAIDVKKIAAQEAEIADDSTPIHPLRLCKEVRDFIDSDTILCVDGQEILNYARRVIPTNVLGNRLNSGPFGTMGVGLPFGLGAKAASTNSKVVVLHGDGSFGLNAMELDTAVRHNLPILIVISLNGGWTGDADQVKPGRNLGYTRFDKMAEALGCHGEYVENPQDIRAALERAAGEVAKGRPAVVNVVTDWRASASTVRFTAYTT